VTVEIKSDGETIADFAQKVRACALGQAAAGIVAENIMGATYDEVSTARTQLRSLLQGDEVDFPSRFDALKYLAPVRDHKSRHASTLLALDGLVDAMDTLRSGEQHRGAAS
jgi:NifU-like protein involved in Fe-S cluster formation